jgi:hypothetical protein
VKTTQGNLRKERMVHYDWWPVLRRSGIYAKLSPMPVEVLQKGKA